MAEQMQAWQTILILLIEYTAFVLGTGAFIFRKRLKGNGFLYRILVSLVMGNILCMNLVFVAYALHCYQRWRIFTLWLLFILWSWLWPIRKELPLKVENIIEVIRKMLSGEYGFHTARKKFFYHIKRALQKRIRTFLKVYFFPHLIEIFFVAGIMIFNLWYNSYQGVHFGGIGVSDVSVHTEWIQKMREGNLFGNGIYPFGFHNIIYLMLTIFQNKLIPVMVFFAAVQDFWIFLLLYLLMRKLFRFPGTAVMGFFVFSVIGIIGNYRYQFTLPQEYGMLGLYPAVLFLWMYLEQKKAEIKTQKIKHERGESKEARRLIRRLNRKVRLREMGTNELAWYFGCSVALTFMCHFYITIACFFLCVGLVLVYPITLFRNKCFWPLVVSVLSCMVMALIPMVGWYAAGKPLEGSLNWAMGVIAGTNEEEDEDDLTKQINEIQYGSVFNSSGNDEETTEDGTAEGSEEGGNSAESSTMTEEEEFWKETGTKPLPQKAYSVLKRICMEIMEKSKAKFFFYGLQLAVVYSCILLLLKKRREQGKLLLGLSAYVFMLLIMARASWFHLPNLIEAGRVAIFIDYVAAIFFACPFDMVTGWCSSIKRFNLLIGFGIYAFNGLLIFQTVAGGQVRNFSVYNMLQYKPALDIAEDIMNEYEDRTWTIVSPVDELPFIRLNGYHYEWLEFLAKQAKYKEDETIYIPTTYVFFYVEKKPLQYAWPVWMSNGKAEFDPVSEEDANTIFNEAEIFTSGLYGSHRNIIESKAYYWAKTYASYFPREMSVYYEDENFICYRLVQDPYRLNNLVIDFKYNIGKLRNEEGQ